MRLAASPGRGYAVCVAALLSTACRTYTPAPQQGVSAGTPARVHLSDRGALDLAALVGPRGEFLDGRIVRSDDSVMVLAVSSVTRLNGVEEGWRGESVSVPHGAVTAVEVPRFSAARSALLAGSIVVGAGILAAVLGGANGLLGKTGRPPGGSK